jgi:hypothetical protein
MATGEPFYCHEDGLQALCRGWVDAFGMRLLKNAAPSKQPQWKLDLWAGLNGIINSFEEMADAGRESEFDCDREVAELMSRLDIQYGSNVRDEMKVCD